MALLAIEGSLLVVWFSRVREFLSSHRVVEYINKKPYQDKRVDLS